MTPRDQWLALRRTGIGGTDAAAILGLSPWSSPLDVWLDKTGRAVPRPSDPDRDDLLFLGNALEPAIAAMYERKTGRRLFKPEEDFGIVRHPAFPMILGTPDRLVVGEPRGVELKSEVPFLDRFGDPGTDEVPDFYVAQCAVYMAVNNFDAWDIALLHGGSKFGIYTLERSRAVENELLDVLVAWWERHVVQDVQPPIDGSDSATRYLAQKFVQNFEPLADATAWEEKLAIELGEKRKDFDAIEEAKAKLENEIREAIGFRDGIRGSFGKVTWKRSKDSTTTDFERAFQDAKTEVAKFLLSRTAEDMSVPIADAETISGLFELALHRHTYTKSGVRRLLYTPAKG